VLVLCTGSNREGLSGRTTLTGYQIRPSGSRQHSILVAGVASIREKLTGFRIRPSCLRQHSVPVAGSGIIGEKLTPCRIRPFGLCQPSIQVESRYTIWEKLTHYRARPSDLRYHPILKAQIARGLPNLQFSSTIKSCLS